MDDSFHEMTSYRESGTEKVVLFHGFSAAELNTLIDALKRAPAFSREIIMATTTETSLTWKVQDLIQELTREKAYFKQQEKQRPPDPSESD